MANSNKTTTMKVSEELYDKLTKIKNSLGITYGELVDKLIELELKENFIIEIGDYEFLTDNGSYYFRVLFKNHENIIEYQNGKHYIRDRTKWEIPPEDKTLFTKFINRKESFDMLKNMGNLINYDNFGIIKY